MRRRVLLPSLVWAMFSCGVLGQQVPQTTPPPAGFDVVSIHLSESTAQSGMMDNSRDKLHVVNVPLKVLIEEAYDLRSFQVTGSSDWMETLGYDIEAKNDLDRSRSEVEESKSAPSIELRQERARVSRLQLQALLADRFHLKVHLIAKVAPAFDLLVDKNGVKLKMVPKEVGNGNWGAGKVEMQGVTVTSFTRALAEAAELERIISDKTGLRGYYNFSLKWASDRDNWADSELPSLGDAMREQLGLQLKPVTETIPFLVIEGAEKASAN